jgi:prepilin-type N-terminal cleavage/methylation domain-containing protein
MNQKGFTLVELMVVIVIIGVLAAVAIPKMMAATNKAKAGEGPSILSTISNLQAVYKAEKSEYVDCEKTTHGQSGAPATGGWADIGLEQNPVSRYYDFEVVTQDDNSAFIAKGVLGVPIGKAPAGESIITIDNNDERTASAQIKELVPNWR